MRKLLAIIIAMTMCGIAYAQTAEDENMLYIAPQTKVEPGKQNVLSVRMKNPDWEIMTIGVWIQLPEGITVATKSNNTLMIALSDERTSADFHNIDFNYHNGYYKVGILHKQGQPFAGTDGEVFTMTVNVAEDMPEGEYDFIMKEVELTDIYNKPHAMPEYVGKITVARPTYADGYVLDIRPMEIACGQDYDPDNENGNAYATVRLQNPETVSTLSFDIALPEKMGVGKYQDRRNEYYDPTYIVAAGAKDYPVAEDNGDCVKVESDAVDFAATDGGKVAVIRIPLTTTADIVPGVYDIRLKNIIANGSVNITPCTVSAIVGGTASLTGDVMLKGTFGDEEDMAVLAKAVTSDAYVTAENVILSDDVDCKVNGAFTAMNICYVADIDAATGYRTMVLPYDCNVPNGVEAYEVSSVYEDKAVMKEVSTIAANVPVVLKNAGIAAMVASDVTVEMGSAQDGAFIGTYKTVPAPEGAYMLHGNGDDIAFCHTNDATVKAYHAYLLPPASAEQIVIDFSNVPTSIDNINHLSSAIAIYSATFNLTGQRVSPSTKGITITNGKKMVQ